MSLSQDDIITLIMDLSPVPGLNAEDVRGSEELLTGGLLDSLGLLEVVEALEAALGHPIPASDISINNFNSLNAITALQTKLAA